MRWPVGLMLAVLMVPWAGCFEGSNAPPGELAMGATVRSLDLDIADMEQDWILYRIHPSGPGNITMHGYLKDLIAREAAPEGADPTVRGLGTCNTARLGDLGFEASMGSSSGERYAAAGQRARMAPIGYTSAFEFLPMQAAVESTTPFFTLFGHSDLTTYKARGAQGLASWEADFEFTMELVAQGPLFCSNDVFDFEGELVKTPAGTTAERLELDLKGDAMTVWFAGFGGEMDIAIETGGGTVGPAHVAGQDGQQHLRVYGVAEAKLVIEDLFAGPSDSESLMVHAIQGLPAEAATWMEERDNALRTRAGVDA